MVALFILSFSVKSVLSNEPLILLFYCDEIIFLNILKVVCIFCCDGLITRPEKIQYRNIKILIVAILNTSINFSSMIEFAAIWGDIYIHIYAPLLSVGKKILCYFNF